MREMCETTQLGAWKEVRNKNFCAGGAQGTNGIGGLKYFDFVVKPLI